MCYHCVIQDNGNDLCFSCWKVEYVSGNMSNSGVHGKTIQQMICEIRDAGTDISYSQSDVGTIIEFYDSLVNRRDLDIVRTTSSNVR